MTVEDIISAQIEADTPAMLEAERYIWAHPQTGFREWDASRYLAGKFRAAGFSLTEAGDIPGFYTDIDTGHPGPLICVLGELDALPVADHPERDPETNAVHACGHNCQAAALIGIAGALANRAVRDSLCGTIRVMAVPAEEIADMDYRLQLRESGVIRYTDGKTELLRRGWFDGAAMCYYIHTDTADTKHPRVYMCGGTVGVAMKRVTYTAEVNWERNHTLYAATVAMDAVNALREKYSGNGLFYTHTIVKQGGEAVNVLPPKVVLENDVRAGTYETLTKANRQINRAFAAGALAMGTEAKINGIGFYMPHVNCDALNDAFVETAKTVPGGNYEILQKPEPVGGGSDFGNLTTVMPATFCYINGASGYMHGASFRVTRPEWAVAESARLQALFAYRMLKDGAAALRAAVKDFKPLFPSKQALFDALDGFLGERGCLTYTESGANVTY